jgi:hypothetical protein
MHTTTRTEVEEICGFLADRRMVFLGIQGKALGGRDELLVNSWSSDLHLAHGSCI